MLPSSQGDPCVPTSKSPPPAPNGAKSRGPVTSRGKQNSSRNGIRHGAFARAHPIAPQFKEFFQARLVGFTAYSYLLQHTRPAVASSYAYVNPVIAVVLGIAFAA